jgi:hypothetical protein
MEATNSLDPMRLQMEILLEIRHLRSRLDQIDKDRSASSRIWLTPAEMGKLVGVTPRTLQNYVNTGRLSRASHKKTPRGTGFVYRYHREIVLHDLGVA